MMGGRVSVVMALALVTSACSGGTSDSPAPTTTATSSADPVDIAPSGAFRFSLDTAAAVEATVTSTDGGTLTAVASDGSVFELSVPADAILEDTVITMTPLVDIEGLGSGPVHAVRLEPEGLMFYEFARLTITPSTPIPIADQLMFQSLGDGTEVIAAAVDVSSEPIVILVPHFSAAGVALGQFEAQLLIGRATNALQRLVHESNLILQAERKKQTTGAPPRPAGPTGSGDTQPSDYENSAAATEQVRPLLEQAQREVLNPLKEAALLSCTPEPVPGSDPPRSLTPVDRYVQALLTIQRQIELLGLTPNEAEDDASEDPSGVVLDETASLLESAFRPCERAAITECLAAKPRPDPGILERFWISWDRQLELAGFPPRGLPDDFEERAKRLCSKGFQFQFFGAGTASFFWGSPPITWGYYGLLCPGDKEWQVWEQVDIEGVGSENTGLPGDEPNIPLRVTFDQSGAMTGAVFPPIGQSPPGFLLHGTRLALIPGEQPTMVSAAISAGQNTITVTAPVVPYDGSFGNCPSVSGG